MSGLYKQDLEYSICYNASMGNLSTKRECDITTQQLPVAMKKEPFVILFIPFPDYNANKATTQ